MARYKIKIWREVVSVEEVTRVYEAEDETAALELARAEAYEFDHSCPGDAEESGIVECRSWQVDWDDVEETDDAPNRETEAALEAAARREVVRFANVTDLMADLNDDDVEETDDAPTG